MKIKIVIDIEPSDSSATVSEMVNAVYKAISSGKTVVINEVIE